MSYRNIHYLKKGRWFINPSLILFLQSITGIVPVWTYDTTSIHVKHHISRCSKRLKLSIGHILLFICIYIGRRYVQASSLLLFFSLISFLSSIFEKKPIWELVVSESTKLRRGIQLTATNVRGVQTKSVTRTVPRVVRSI